MAKKTLNLTNLTTSRLAQVLGACPEHKTRTKKYGNKLIKTVWEQEATEEDMLWLVVTLDNMDVGVEEVEDDRAHEPGHYCGHPGCDLAKEQEKKDLAAEDGDEEEFRNDMLRRYPWENVEAALQEASVVLLDQREEKREQAKELLKSAQFVVKKLSDPDFVDSLSLNALEKVYIETDSLEHSEDYY